MKPLIISLLFLCMACSANAQLKLADKDFNNLVALGELYTHNNMFNDAKTMEAAGALRTPLLNHMIDALIATGKADTGIINTRFLSRPSNDEMKLWYVLREIHYERVDTARKHLPAAEVAKNVLSQQIDERWLLANYYYRIHGGLAMLFNNADLSMYNLETDKLGLKNDTEKAIFFLSITDGLIGGRFKVLQYMKKYDRVAEFASKMPMFNGKPYFYYTNLNIEDFEFIGYDKKESYLTREIESLINTLSVHFMGATAVKMQYSPREIYINSILHHPEIFKYSTSKEVLQQMYDKSK